MSSPVLGLTFRETMSGGFSLGATDPEIGWRQGDAADTSLSMHATVSIDDLDRFLAEPTHAGALSGTLDYPPLGNGIAARRGVFNLFNPSGSPGLKLMVYELGFAHGGRSYYLAGRKEVRNEPGFDVWKDTTTLFTRLHEGNDASGAIVGAGKLSLGVTDLIRMLGTVDVTNATTTAQRVDALTRFSRFFLGELWDSYAPHLGLSS